MSTASHFWTCCAVEPNTHSHIGQKQETLCSENAVMHACIREQCCYLACCYLAFSSRINTITFVNTSLVFRCSHTYCCSYIFFSDPTVLKDTLVLIERQSHTLETHSEYLFSSILSAMDCLTDPRSEEASGNDLLL